MILSRRVGETLCIGPDIQVTIMQVHGRHVRVGIKAPPQVAVDRQEIRERKDRDSRDPYPDHMGTKEVAEALKVPPLHTLGDHL